MLLCVWEFPFFPWIRIKLPTGSKRIQSKKSKQETLASGGHTDPPPHLALKAMRVPYNLSSRDGTPTKSDSFGCSCDNDVSPCMHRWPHGKQILLAPAHPRTVINVRASITFLYYIWKPSSRPRCSNLKYITEIFSRKSPFATSAKIVTVAFRHYQAHTRVRFNQPRPKAEYPPLPLRSSSGRKSRSAWGAVKSRWIIEHGIVWEASTWRNNWTQRDARSGQLGASIEHTMLWVAFNLEE